MSRTIGFKNYDPYSMQFIAVASSPEKIVRMYSVTVNLENVQNVDV